MGNRDSESFTLQAATKYKEKKRVESLALRISVSSWDSPFLLPKHRPGED
jgi:hypothetical protein